jgi:membrane protein implicated in regulation of membrane protease activity
MQNNKRVMKRNVKRMAWFLGIYFVFALFFSSLLLIAGVPQWLNMLILVVTAGICYLLFWLVCDKIDKKNEEREKEKEKEFDPFAD